jgi:tartrate-resistant acid phosphatase type 5
MIRIVVFVICLFVYGAIHAQDHIRIDHPTLSFIVIGDWGRHGSRTQRRVAAAMDELAARTRVDLIISTGDNFYENGVRSENDRLWRKNFEAVYSLPHLKAIPWYVVLGNHDYRGNIRAQVDYGKLHANWNLPNYYYQETFLLNDDTRAQFIFIDTTPLIPRYQRWPGRHRAVKSQDPEAQMAWLRNTLREPKPVWRLVVGHHTIYSSGRRHGDTEVLQALLVPLFDHYDVDAYFGGHDHHLEHYFQPEGWTHYFISGGGAEHRWVKRRPYSQFAAASAGFAHVVLDKNCLTIQFINDKGEVLYVASVPADIDAECER